MYHLVTGLYAHYTQKPRYNVLLLGISGSGKSAWLDKVRSRVSKTASRSLRRFQPTVGQNVLDVHLSRATLHFWDLGGRESLRRLWRRYYEGADLLVWAMDAQDWVDLFTESSQDRYNDEEQRLHHSQRREESWNTLAELATHSTLTALPLLILFTHMDELESETVALFEKQIRSLLQERLSDLRKAEDVGLQEELDQLDDSLHGKESRRQIWNEWTVVTGSAADGSGVDDSIAWLHEHAKR